MQRLIFHVDVNSAYLSWEAARRVSQGLDDLRLIPSAIGGDPAKRTGVILAKSIPAKRFGVRTGEPVASALRKCPSLVLARPDFRLYVKNSRAFADVCRRYAPVVEQVSIDECFLDMTGTDYLYPDPLRIARTIKDAVRDELGFTVNVGVSRNKLLAKMASDFEKPDKVHTLYPEEVAQKMWPLPVGELFSVGHATAEKLRRGSIRTIGELAAADVRVVQRLVGVSMGAQIHAYANGVDDSPVAAEAEAAKGYSISTTLEDDVRTAESAKQILLALSDSVTAHMRQEGRRAACIAVTIRANDFKNRSHQRHLENTTDVTDEVYAASASLFDELWDRKTPLRLLGISLTDITDEETAQLSLFQDEKRERARKRDQAVDAIRRKFGSDTIVRGSTLHSAGSVGRKYRAQAEDDRQLPGDDEPWD
ncbi:MAG: DNA polymerase IV [Oscillospiraceae bacterium]|nr:DNA polymerase IV [Oscillospiraceae bacterium]